MNNPPEKHGAFRRRALALIASGAVLGLGATAVLANWTDVERAFDEFGTSTFVLEGAAQKADCTWEPFANHNTTDGTLEAKLNFGDASTRVHPGMVMSAQYKVRLTSDLPSEMVIKPKFPDAGAAVPLADFIETATQIGSDKLSGCERVGNVSSDGWESGILNGDVLSLPPSPAGEELIFSILVKFKETNAQGEPLPQGSTADLNKFSWVVTAESGHRTFEREAAVLQADGTWAPYAKADPEGAPIFPLHFGDAATPVYSGLVVGAKYKVRLTSDTEVSGWVSDLPAIFDTASEPLLRFMDVKTVVSASDAPCDGSAVDFDAVADIGDHPIAPGEENYYCTFVRFNGADLSGDSLPEGSTMDLNRVPWFVDTNR